MPIYTSLSNFFFLTHLPRPLLHNLNLLITTKHLQLLTDMEFTPMFCWFASFLLIFLLNSLIKSFKSERRELPLPPGSMGWPYIGETFQLCFRYSNVFFASKIKKFGSIFKSHVLGCPWAMISSPEAAKFVLNNVRLFKPTFPASKEGMLGKQAIFSHQGESHADLRRLVLRTLMPEAIKNIVPDIQSIGQDFVKSWEGQLITSFLEMKTRQSLIGELLASHSTDLQQRAYELQALIGLDRLAGETIMPRDASYEDIEVDKILSFLEGYVQQSLERGAQPYIPEGVRTGMGNISSFRGQDKHESSEHEVDGEKTNHQAPPDLLDLGEPTVATAPPSVDPFKQLEGLLDPSLCSTIDHSTDATTKVPDIMAFNGGTSVGYPFPVSGELERSNAAVRGAPGETIVTPSTPSVKGPNPIDSLEKDSLMRQLGVNPSSQNPNLFGDLLG